MLSIHVGFLFFYFFLSNLYPNLTKPSCGGSPVHLHHEIEKNNHGLD
jgi:hypothetical protein